MRFSVLTTFGLFMSACAANSVKCVESHSSSMKFSLLSKRNQTGHRIAQVKLEHGGNEAGEKASWEVDLEHTTTLCDGQETINIMATVKAPPAIPGPGYMLFPRMGYYKFHSSGLIWTEALRVCAQEGAHLAIINSKEEANFLKDVFARYPKVQNTIDNSFAFLGYHDFYNEGKFETIFGQPLNSTGYNVFIPGNPNNVPVGIDHDQDCGGMSRTGLLNDLPCNSRYGFFCEMELPQ